MLGLRRISSSTTGLGPNPRPLHEAGNPFPIHGPAGRPQIGRHPGTPVAVPVPLMPGLQFHEQARVLLGSLRWLLGPALPSIISTASYA